MNDVGRYDDASPFLITDNQLVLKVNLPQQHGDFYLVYENNGVTERRRLSANESVKLDNLVKGEFNADLKHYLNGVLIKSYKIEPLTLIEEDSTLTGLPEIEALKNTDSDLAALIKAQEQRLTDIKYSLKELTAQIVKHNEFIAELYKFALEDITNNPFLSVDADEFKKKFETTEQAEE
jgi:DNA polymerase elongation subunit (family B)